MKMFHELWHGVAESPAQLSEYCFLRQRLPFEHRLHVLGPGVAEGGVQQLPVRVPLRLLGVALQGVEHLLIQEVVRVTEHAGAQQGEK